MYVIIIMSNVYDYDIFNVFDKKGSIVCISVSTNVLGKCMISP